MKFLFYMGHPAHFHLFKHVIDNLKSNGHKVTVAIRTKDVLTNLLEAHGMEYINILPGGRKDKKWAIILGLLKRDWRLFRGMIGKRYDLTIGTEAALAHMEFLLHVPSVIVEEDDTHAIPYFAKTTYPFASCILAPVSCNIGKWSYKKVAYKGYHELAYLSPKYFTPDASLLKDFIEIDKPYFIIRFAKLGAHHDEGRKGIDTEIARRLIDILKPKGRVYITSERELEPEFETYRIKIPPELIHHAMYFATLYIGDSQTMAAEAAVLGTPAIRFNDFVGELGYLEELEHTYDLTYGILTKDEEKLFQKVEELVNKEGLKEEWKKKREFMLKDTIDVCEFMTWLFENYPNSKEIIKDDPSYAGRFKNIEDGSE